MEDKTPIYMIIIVAIVAIVGLVAVLMHGSIAPADTTATADTGAGITGNIVYSDTTPNLNTFGKVFFVVLLIGIAAYMYFQKED